MDIYMYWLSTLHTMVSRKRNRLLYHFGSAQGVFCATDNELAEIPGITVNDIRKISKSRNFEKLSREADALRQRGIRFIPRDSPEFPGLLKEISDPPIGLYTIGTLPPDNMPCAAIIGSRRCSQYGLSTARKFGVDLARHKVVIVSGMARGIDSMAHRGAIEGGGLTIAVLGCGVDVCYPPENHKLKDDIAKNGCVVSEYPLGTEPHASHFPARNRIISGLSQVTVVVESARKSGTLITVDQALEQGRNVMAVPGNITNKYSEGTNNLIKQGAEPAVSYQDVLHVLGMNEGADSKKQEKTKEATAQHLAPEEKLVYDMLDFEPLAFEEIIKKAESQPHVVQYILTKLEIKGYVKKLPGLRYVKEQF